MYILKIDLPTGVAYFTGKKKVVQGSEAPGLTGTPAEARQFATEEEATRFCKMLGKKYDMEFYYSLEDIGDSVNKADGEDDFMLEIDKNLMAGVMDSDDEDKDTGDTGNN